MRKQKTRPTPKILLALLTVICLITYIVLLQREGFAAVTRYKDLGKYRIYSEEKVPRAGSPSFTVSEDQIYIFYENVGLINVYTAQGDFCYGIHVGCLSNGKGDFTVDRGTLYLKCRGNIAYTFTGTTLLSFCTYADDPAAFEAIEKLTRREKIHQIGDRQYRLNPSGQLVKADEMGKEAIVVKLPSQNSWTSVFLILSGLFAGLFLHFVRKTGGQKGVIQRRYL